MIHLDPTEPIARLHVARIDNYFQQTTTRSVKNCISALGQWHHWMNALADGSARSDGTTYEGFKDLHHSALFKQDMESLESRLHLLQ